MHDLARRPDSTLRSMYGELMTPSLTFPLTEECLYISLQNLLTYEECRQFVKFIDGLPLELTPPKKRGEADRLNRSYLACPLCQALLSTMYSRSNLNNFGGLCKAPLLHPPAPSP